MKLSRLNQSILPEDKYKLYYYDKSAIPAGMSEDEILQQKTPIHTSMTHAVTPTRAKTNAAAQYIWDVWKRPRSQKLSRVDLDKFLNTRVVIVRPEGGSPPRPKMVQGTLF
jgi:hypothetical protein